MPAHYACALKETYDHAACKLRAGCKEVNGAIVAAIQAIDDDETRQCIVAAYVVFPFVDRVVFPLMDSAKVEDLTEIDVLRVSPADTDLLADIDDPLRGDELGAFAGFLRRRWRENDLLWGRLNGAERLVDPIARAAVPDDRTYKQEAVKDLRRAFKIKAMQAVLADEAERPRTSIGRTRSRVRHKLDCAAASAPSRRGVGRTPIAESGSIVNPQGTFDRIIASLHESMLDASHWRETSALIEDACGIADSQLLIVGGDSHHGRGEPREDLGPEGCVTDMPGLYIEAERNTSSTHDELLRPSGARNGLNIPMDGPNGLHVAWVLAKPTTAAGAPHRSR